jgi:hypothetical protein
MGNIEHHFWQVWRECDCNRNSFNQIVSAHVPRLGTKNAAGSADERLATSADAGGLIRLNNAPFTAADY